MKKIIIFISTIYFSLNFIMAIYFCSEEFKTFKCIAPDEPHEYIGVRIKSFINPDTERCIRRGFTLQSAQTIPIIITAGMPISIFKYYKNKQLYNPANYDY